MSSELTQEILHQIETVKKELVNNWTSPAHISKTARKEGKFILEDLGHGEGCLFFILLENGEERFRFPMQVGGLSTLNKHILKQRQGQADQALSFLSVWEIEKKSQEKFNG